MSIVAEITSPVEDSVVTLGVPFVVQIQQTIAGGSITGGICDVQYAPGPDGPWAGVSHVPNGGAIQLGPRKWAAHDETYAVGAKIVEGVGGEGEVWIRVAVWPSIADVSNPPEDYPTQPVRLVVTS